MQTQLQAYLEQIVDQRCNQITSKWMSLFWRISCNNRSSSHATYFIRVEDFSCWSLLLIILIL